MSGDQGHIDDLFAQIVSGIDAPEAPEEGYMVRTGDVVQNRLPEPARRMLALLAGLVADSIELERVPQTYAAPDDQAAYELLAGAALADELADACTTVQRTALADVVAVADLDAWLRVTNTLRARLTGGVASAEDLEQLWAEGGERAELLGFVSAVQRETLEALLD